MGQSSDPTQSSKKKKLLVETRGGLVSIIINSLWELDPRPKVFFHLIQIAYVSNGSQEMLQ
jgi:hypothetical protein